jgi:hypothetical protein
MGRERSWKMERLFLYIASGMILLAFTMGCASFSSQKPKRQDFQGTAAVAAELAGADTAIANGDFPLALQKNMDISAQYPDVLADQILFQRGRIHSHPRNPEQNLPTAIEVFRELTEKYPTSRWGGEAEAWISTIEGIILKDQALIVLKKDLRKREKTIAQLTTQATGRQALIKQLNSQLLQLESQVSELEGQIEKLKKVDLGIEEKKRTRTEP